MIRGLSRWLDERLGIAKVANKQFNKVFPDHWSFELGSLTMYCFIVLLVTGAYLTFFFEPSSRQVVYDGPYEPLQGAHVSAAFDSALAISFETRAGLVARQMHHWAALLFLAAMVVHVLRVFFTGAYRKPRELNWVIGVNLLILSMFNGFLGYSLLDDLLSGTGVRVGYSILLSVPIVGPDAANLVFGGEFPSPSLIPRFYTLHVLLLPLAILGLMSAHLALVWTQKHTQFRGPGRKEDNVVGSRFFPTYALKTTGLMLLVVGVIGALGGLVQINPVWVFGPFEGPTVASSVTSAAQPDWYMGWMDGMLRLIPGWEFREWGYSIPNPFLGGILIPGITFTGMILWPFLEPKWTKDRKAHNLLDRPRDNPFRTAFGAAVLSFYVVLFFSGSNDVLGVVFNVAPETLIYAFRVMIFVVPLVTFFVTRQVCRELEGTNAHPAAPGPNHLVMRTAEGGYEFAHGTHHDAPEDRVYDPDNTKAPAPTKTLEA